MRIVYTCPELASSVSSWSSCGKEWTERYKCDASFSTLLFSRTTESQLNAICLFFIYIIAPITNKIKQQYSPPYTFTSHFEMATEEVAPSYTLSGKCNQSRRSRR